MEDTDREWVRSEIAGLATVAADMEQRLRARIHDAADHANALFAESAIAVRSLETWREVHLMESKLRGEALLARFDRTDAALGAQEASISTLKIAVNRWGGALALILVLIPIALWVATKLVK